MRDPSDKPITTRWFILGIGVLWIALARLIDLTIRRFRWRGVELVGELNDERWHVTFRQLALRSRVIVMDISAKSEGIAYESDFLVDLGLAEHLMLVHDGSQDAAETLELLRRRAVTAPVVSYNKWRVHQYSRDLREAATLLRDSQEPQQRLGRMKS